MLIADNISNIYFHGRPLGETGIYTLGNWDLEPKILENRKSAA